MLLDLSRIRTPHEHFEQVYPAEAFAADQEDFRVVAPVSLAFDIFKDKPRDHFRLAGRTQTTLELPCSRCLEPFACRSTRRSTCGTSRTRRTPPARQGDEREIEEDDFTTAFYENDEIDLGQLMREQFYLALPMKPLCDDDVPGAVPGVRHESEPGHVRVPARLGRPAVRGAQDAGEQARLDDEGLDRCRIQNDDIPRRGRPSAARTTRSSRPACRECPHCHEPKPPHRVCANCGYYRGRQVRAVEED